jgi:hypothetical protein
MQTQWMVSLIQWRLQQMSNHWVFQSITNYTLLTISVFMKKGERDLVINSTSFRR